VTRRKVYPSELLAEVAQVCVEAHGRQPHARAVSTHFGMSLTCARQHIVAARSAGFELPADDAKWRYTHPRFDLACSCGWSCSLDAGMPGLQRHTLSVHGRNPSRDERIPQSAQVAA